MVQRIPGGIETHFRAVERVEALLRKATKALDAAGIAYSIIGGNAVAGWISTIDPDATRATRDVDVLIRRKDLDAVTQALKRLGLYRYDGPGFPIFVGRDHPRPKSGLHIFFANEHVKASDRHPTPDVDPELRGVEGYRIVNLPALVTMKLIAFRFHDRGHIVDLASVGLIDDAFAEKIPEDLRPRLKEVLDEGRKQGSIV